MNKPLVVKPPVVLNEFSATQQTDVYMYGTLLYEIFTETPPFQCQEAHAVIYQIGKGVLPNVQKIQCAQAFKVNVKIFFTNKNRDKLKMLKTVEDASLKL